MRVVSSYRAKTMRKLGVRVTLDGRLSAPFSHQATSERLRPVFGRMVGLWRCHHAGSSILERCHMISESNEIVLRQRATGRCWNVLMPAYAAVRSRHYGYINSTLYTTGFATYLAETDKDRIGALGEQVSLHRHREGRHCHRVACVVAVILAARIALMGRDLHSAQRH